MMTVAPVWLQDAPDLGVFDDWPLMLGGHRMTCPTCGKESPPSWKLLQVGLDKMGQPNVELEAPQPHARIVAVDWMRCAHDKCRELIIRVHEGYRPDYRAGQITTASWIARPRFGEATRPISDVVPEPYRTDYAEAAAILDISPRMSAVLARRILADLLSEYAEKNQYKLSERIDAFRSETQHPSGIRDNLHHFREIADFGRLSPPRWNFGRPSTD